MKLWTGRFSGQLDETADLLNASITFDYRLAEVDVRGSMAWAAALGRAKLLTEEEVRQILDGLGAIQKEFKAGSFEFQPGDEDIHTAVERRLTEIIGPLGGKLHTGRSRNDQVATDFRLWMISKIEQIDELISGLQAALTGRAEQDFDIVLPGYTHLQQAQPVLLSHWWLSHFWALQRDRTRFQNLSEETRVMPLGCAALAGTGFDIDRFALAKDLGFDRPAPNSLDAISDRDFAASFLFCATMIGVHLSRLSEQLILFSTKEFGFVTLSDEFSTGSSIMPQKKNPDPLELTRAKSGVLMGRLMALLATLKALPSAYDKDLQEDKPPVFDAADILELLLPVLSGTIATLTVHADRMEAQIDWQMLATDLADHLVRKGVPFREAHHAVGSAVKAAEKQRLALPDLPLVDWEAIHPEFDSELFALFDVRRSLAQHAAFGGTAPDAVQQQLALAQKTLEE
jgi:argininosuccinate lyase